MNSRDKQQGEPEICRESVTIPMVQEVYGSQPQIRAGIGPTEPVRPVSERELVKRLTPFMTDDRSWMQGSVRKILSIINDYVRQQVEAGRLDEAQWWEHLVGAVQPNHPEGFEPDCMYCRRIAAIRARTALIEMAIEMGHEYGRTGTFRPGSPNGLPTPDDVRKRYEERRNDD